MLALSLLGWVLSCSGCATPAAVVKPAQAAQVPQAATVVPTGKAETPGVLACTFDEAAQSEETRALLQEGVALHDRGDYAGAARRYQQVLAKDPENLAALYELTATEMAWGHNEEAVQHAGAAVRCRSHYRPYLFTSLGSALDNLNNPGAAIAAFQEGLIECAAAQARGPVGEDLLRAKEMLLYNLSMTLLKQGRHDEARARAEEAVLIRPSHASAYLVLAAAHQRLGNRVPALLALLRFLCLEPATERSKRIARQIAELMDAGVDRDKRTLNVAASNASSEGDFRAAELLLGVVSAAGGPDADTRQKQLTGLAELLAQPSDTRSFTTRHSVAFLVTAQKQNLLEPLAQLLTALQDSPEAAAWIQANAQRVEQLVRFAQGFANP
jgi:tetratricopeptide (TPR) repeat protein